MKPHFAATIAATLALSCATVLAQDHNLAGMKQPGMMQPGMMNMTGPAIDVPVTLGEARVVMRIDRDNPKGDNSFALQQIAMLAEKFKQLGTDAKVVAVFNGDGGYMLLKDMAYDRTRGTNTGNPYKAAIERLLAQGVQVEECGMTMMREKWSNQQLLGGVKVNAGANLRIIELAQKGYVVLNP